MIFFTKSPFWTALYMALCIGCNLALADDTPIAVKASLPTPGVTCGINCIYAVCKLTQNKVKYIDLLDRKYIGSDQGSSLEDLSNAASDLGLPCKALKNLDFVDLRHFNVPVIIHVRDSVFSKKYDHWVLIVPGANDRLYLYDAPNSPQMVTESDLAWKWDGIGLVFSKDATKASFLYGAQGTLAFIVGFLTLFTFGFKIVGTRYSSGRPPSGAPTWAWQSLAIFFVGGATGILYHYYAPIGLLKNSHGFTAMERPYSDAVFPKLTGLLPKIDTI